MTHSVETDTSAHWAIEVERLDTNQPSEFFNVAALQVVNDELQIITPGGTQVSFKTKDVRKVLLMRVKDKTP